MTIHEILMPLDALKTRELQYVTERAEKEKANVLICGSYVTRTSLGIFNPF